MFLLGQGEAVALLLLREAIDQFRETGVHFSRAMRILQPLETKRHQEDLLVVRLLVAHELGQHVRCHSLVPLGNRGVPVPRRDRDVALVPCRDRYGTLGCPLGDHHSLRVHGELAVPLRDARPKLAHAQKQEARSHVARKGDCQGKLSRS